MLTAFITDQHFGVRSDSKVFLKNFEKFYSEVFFPTLVEKKIKRVVGLGDAWENRRTTNSFTLDATRKMYFDELKRLGIEHVMIYGNHDVFHRDSNDVNMVDHLESMYDNVKVVKTHEVIDIGVPFGLISWIHKNNVEESLEWMQSVDAEYLGGHFEIKDFEMTRGQFATHGFDRSVFKRFKHVYSGHFHVRSTQGNITYLSNPSQTTYADLDLKKGFHIFDSEDQSMTPVDNPFDMFKAITWEVDEANVEDFRGKYGKIRVPVFAESDRAKLDIFVGQVREVCVDLQVIENTVQIDGVNVDVDDNISTPAIIDEYISDAVGATPGLDPEVLRGYFHELYEAAAAKMEVE